MGIRGLTFYINNNSDYYYEKFSLQNTKLVIDGWCLSSEIYRYQSSCNCTFGGDYHQYAKSVETFFEELEKCNVEPIVILDGGWEKKKNKTIFLRAKQILDLASRWEPKSQDNDKYPPVLWADVFKNVMKKLKIKFFQCPFEADDIVVALAKIFKCPVLSNDSDYYISEVLYIPIKTLKNDIIKNEHGYMKECQLYKVEKLLRQFEGLDVSVLPLASVLIGNDYAEIGTFDNFFEKLQLKMGYGNSQYMNVKKKISLVFNWLKNCSLNSAVGIVIKSITKQKRKEMLNLIENTINSSNSSLPIYMLEPLGFSKDILDNQVDQFKFNENDFKLNENANILQFDENDEDHEKDYYFYEDQDDYHVDDNVESDTTVNLTPEEFINTLPKWFLEEFLVGDLSSSFIMMMTQQKCSMKVLIEDFSAPSSAEMSLPIVIATFSLLIPEEKHESTLEIMIREKYDFVKRSIKVKRSTIGLEKLRDVDISERKKFIDKVLGINENDKLNEIPTAWQLYIATILFWMRQKVVPSRTPNHLTCLLLSMLIGIIDEHMEPRKSELRHEKINIEIDNIKFKKLPSKIINLDCENKTVIEALDLVTQDDCIVASQYFMDNFKMNDKLCSKKNPMKFNINTVHVFAQFQSCLERAIMLNALLGKPYTPVCPSKFFHGTLMYNVHTSLKEQTDVVTYIQKKLEYSPDLFRVFKLLHNKIFAVLMIKTPKKNSHVPKVPVIKVPKSDLFFPEFSSRYKKKYNCIIDYDDDDKFL